MNDKRLEEILYELEKKSYLLTEENHHEYANCRQEAISSIKSLILERLPNLTDEQRKAAEEL